MKNGTKLFPMSTSVSAVFYIQLNRAKAMLTLSHTAHLETSETRGGKILTPL
jgi:hypothetical protein